MMISLDDDDNSLTITNGIATPAFAEDYNFDPRWWTGPIDKIQTRLAQIPEDTDGLAVLVTTGAFCPIHKGHVQLLETAKMELESRGMTVLGGYICPDHDQYVSSKIQSGSLSAVQRLELCEIAVEDNDWLMVDRWAAIYASGSVGFTTIVSHIDKMVKHHIKTTKPIHIVYTFGGDNAMFAFSFVARWSCICVLRPGSLDFFNEMTSYDSLRRNPRIIFSEDTTAPLDSTSVRKGDLSGLLPKVKNRWLSLQQSKGETLKSDPSILPSIDTFYIRNEGKWAVQPFLKHSNCSLDHSLQAYNMFCKKLQYVFQLAFDFRHTVQVLKLQGQEIKLRQLLSAGKNIISLDPCLSGSHNLGVWHVSRPLVKASTAIVAHTEQTPPGEHIGQAKAGEYLLLAEQLPLDAETEGLIAQRLPAGCTISQHLSHSDLRTSTSEDIANTSQIQGIPLNARDFLAGSHEAGTVLQLGEAQFVRAPNILPYVRPSHRTHVDVTVEVGFSKAIWELNRQFYQAVGGGLMVKDTALEFQALCKAQGFPTDMQMMDLCDWHLTAFEYMDFIELKTRKEDKVEPTYESA
ncbi:Nicotinamide/nicotinic acid mononucleotide adenylyltransferase 2 [Didymosphaeria variabile]|uniref:Nicotinamide/nicotinic acid mononucleotide adenylyltransferase 2 n=1 Tax=Didymosphaeria variabile TaxID=1932322 RepID=A0A9W9CE86_9PLEO|nr:Nicotinamide/nicotinic acid mononucleotide adenylyltransferase 2 [Didymosphaeria variabile]KAJ4357695.1 Nicotinamide/nicotinic acid mononucleotide adenylyltransferase 2 [Didymosphaeria variabile]